MEGIILKVIFLHLISTQMVSLSFPIYNGFSVKFSPLAVKEEPKVKDFGSIFTKVPQEMTDQDYWKEFLSDTYSLLNDPHGNSNQIAKVLPMQKKDEYNYVERPLSLPLLQQPYNSYRILVATAPPNFRLNDNEHTFVYIIFPDEGEPLQELNMPTVYFVKSGDFKPESKDKEESLYIVDSNRTVTGIRSKKVPKYVNFRNKLLNRYEYDVVEN